MIALQLDQTFVARERTYVRMASDVTAIRRSNPNPPFPLDLFTVTFRLHVLVDEVSFPSLVQNGGPTWDCLNHWYGITDVYILNNTAAIAFDGTYDLDALGVEFERRIPEILFNSGAIQFYDPLVVGRQGETYHYFFQRGFGDCPSGCIHTEVLYARSTPPSEPRTLGYYSTDSGAPPPDWWSVFRAAQQGLPLPMATSVPALSWAGRGLMLMAIAALGVLLLRRH